MDGALTLKFVYNYCVQSCVFYASNPVSSICNQSIPIYLSIGIDNRYQLITTRIFAIDWSSIININRLIDIDWYRLISIVIDYRFHRLDRPGHVEAKDILSVLQRLSLSHEESESRLASEILTKIGGQDSDQSGRVLDESLHKFVGAVNDVVCMCYKSVEKIKVVRS